MTKDEKVEGVEKGKTLLHDRKMEGRYRNIDKRQEAREQISVNN